MIYEKLKEHISKDKKVVLFKGKNLYLLDVSDKATLDIDILLHSSVESMYFHNEEEALNLFQDKVLQLEAM